MKGKKVYFFKDNIFECCGMQTNVDQAVNQTDVAAFPSDGAGALVQVAEVEFPHKSTQVVPQAHDLG